MHRFGDIGGVSFVAVSIDRCSAVAYPGKN